MILAGAGHAHAQVLRAWADAPRHDIERVVVSPHAMAPYSGMVPGWLAGTYRFDEIAIDFEALSRRAGARWIDAAIDAVDPDGRRVRLDDGRTLPYDRLSLNVGSTLRPPGGPLADRTLALRPLARLRAAYEALLDRWRTDPGAGPFRVAAVGGGAAGFEALLAVLARLRGIRPDRVVTGLLVSRGPVLLDGYPSPVRHAAARALRAAGVAVRLGTDWHDGVAPDSDLVLWATGAQAHAWQRDPLRRGALAVTDEGFVRIDRTLRSISHPEVFAVGDCAAWSPPLPKAGVYAVRMGPVLRHNLHASLDGTDPAPYVPQRRFLSLLNTSDGRALAARGALGLSGRWAWRLKDRIDRGFVRGFDGPPQA